MQLSIVLPVLILFPLPLPDWEAGGVKKCRWQNSTTQISFKNSFNILPNNFFYLSQTPTCFRTSMFATTCVQIDQCSCCDTFRMYLLIVSIRSITAPFIPNFLIRIYVPPSRQVNQPQISTTLDHSTASLMSRENTKNFNTTEDEDAVLIPIRR